MPKITKLSKIIVVYDTIPNVVNMKFQVYLQIPGQIHFNCHSFSHGINLLFFKIYVLNEIFGGKMFSHSNFAKVIVYCSLPCSEFCSKYLTFMTVVFISNTTVRT